MRKDVFSSIAAKVGSAFFNFCVLIITSRLLGVELRGDLAYTIAFSLTVAALISISLENSFISIVNKVKNRREMYSTFVSFLFYLSVFCFIFTLSLTTLFDFNFSVNVFLIALIASSTLMGKCLIGLYLADGDLYRYNLNLVFTRLLYLILSFSAISIFGLEVAGILYSFLLVQVLSIIIIWKQKKIRLNLRLNRAESCQLFFNSLKVHFSTLGTIFSVQIPLMLIGLLSTKKNVALFDTSFQIISILTLIISSLSPVIFSQIANSSTLNSLKSTLNLIRWTYIFITPISIISFIFAKEIVLILFGSDFLGAVDILRALLLMFWFNAISYFVCPLWIMNNDIYKLSLINLSAGIINTVGAYFIISFFEIIHLTYLMIASASVVFILHYLYTLKLTIDKNRTVNVD